jgi:hypothetical protein
MFYANPKLADFSDFGGVCSNSFRMGLHHQLQLA